MMINFGIFRLILINFNINCLIYFFLYLVNRFSVIFMIMIVINVKIVINNVECVLIIIWVNKFFL